MTDRQLWLRLDALFTKLQGNKTPTPTPASPSKPNFNLDIAGTNTDKTEVWRRTKTSRRCPSCLKHVYLCTTLRWLSQLQSVRNKVQFYSGRLLSKQWSVRRMCGSLRKSCVWTVALYCSRVVRRVRIGLDMFCPGSRELIRPGRPTGRDGEGTCQNGLRPHAEFG